jgi:hypothetical protein
MKKRNEKQKPETGGRPRIISKKRETGEEEGLTAQMPVRVYNSPTWGPRHSTSSIKDISAVLNVNDTWASRRATLGGSILWRIS